MIHDFVNFNLLFQQILFVIQMQQDTLSFNYLKILEFLLCTNLHAIAHLKHFAVFSSVIPNSICKIYDCPG